MGMVLTVLISDDLTDESEISYLIESTQIHLDQVLKDGVKFDVHLHDIDLAGANLGSVEFDIMPEVTDEDLSEEE